jgi:suppressor for copper-sensitivity B
MIRIFFAFLFFLLPAQAFALTGDWVKDDAVAVRLVSGNTGVGADASVPLGLEVQLANGWHTYWRSPGEAGLPPQLDWSRSQTDANNLQDAKLLYPAPRRYTAYGLETIGYRDHVLFPIDATLRKAGLALNADVSVDILVCSSICVPKHFDLKLTVPNGAANPSAEADILRLARDQLPSIDFESTGILLADVTSDGQSLTFSITARDPLIHPDIFIENYRNIGFSAPDVKIEASGFAAKLKVKLLDNLPPGITLARLPLRLTIVTDDRALEIKTVTPSALSPPPVFVPQQPSFKLALLFALLGGFILNLMPCVLPVLSLKIVSVVSHGGGESGKVRLSFLVTAAGILFSFLVLAGVMVALKSLGLALGWGVQFQQPVFLMILVFLLTFFAANLWDLFDIALPQVLADKMNNPYHPKLAGDFATGAFATMLATPCSAPFLGTAVGFALATGAFETVAIFTVLGLGMALPYLVVTLFPSVATCLPKPGAWMIRLRQCLGFALAATALWLIWVMGAQITLAYAAGFGALMIVLMFALFLKKHVIKNHWMTAGVVLVCVAALAVGLRGTFEPKTSAQADRQWLAYSPMALTADVAEGKTVFLDVAAEWCLTCKANMKFTLANKDVVQRLFHTDVIAMQADWTNPNPVVSELLHKYGRYGIPFTIVFGPAAPQGIVLPELLTPTIVLKALDEATAAAN